MQHAACFFKNLSPSLILSPELYSVAALNFPEIISSLSSVGCFLIEQLKVNRQLIDHHLGGG